MMTLYQLLLLVGSSFHYSNVALALAASPTPTKISSQHSSVIDLQSQHVVSSPVETFNSLASSCTSIGIDSFDVYGDFDKNDPLQPYKRYKITYFGLQINNEDGNPDNDFYGVYKTKESWIENDDNPMGNWTSRCTECYTNQLVRSHLVDMEFLLFDENGHHLWKDGDYPLPNNDQRINLYKIKQVDMSLIFRSNKEFFKIPPKQKKFLKTLRKERYGGDGFGDRYLRDNVVVSIHTRNIGR